MDATSATPGLAVNGLIEFKLYSKLIHATQSSISPGDKNMIGGRSAFTGKRKFSITKVLEDRITPGIDSSQTEMNPAVLSYRQGGI